MLLKLNHLFGEVFMKSFNTLAWTGFLVICCLLPDAGQAKSNSIFKVEKNKHSETFKHDIQLQLSDPYGIPVPYAKIDPPPKRM
jgi:hypothetical protein